MKKAFILFCLILLPFSGKLYAQGSVRRSPEKFLPYRNSVYFEYLGNGMAGSFNYERLLPYHAAPGTMLAWRIGGLFIPEGSAEGRPLYWLSVPVELSMFYGKRTVKLEFGVGLTYLESVFTEEPDAFVKDYKGCLAVPRFGLRYEKAGSPFFGRLGVMPLVIIGINNGNHDYSSPVLPWLGLSFGCHFGRK